MVYVHVHNLLCHSHFKAFVSIHLGLVLENSKFAKLSSRSLFNNYFWVHVLPRLLFHTDDDVTSDESKHSLFYLVFQTSASLSYTNVKRRSTLCTTTFG